MTDPEFERVTLQFFGVHAPRPSVAGRSAAQIVHENVLAQKAMVREVAEVEAASFIDQPPWQAGDLQALLDEGTATVVLVRRAERCIGYALTRTIPPEAELLRIAIHPEFQGKGLGKLLLNELIAALRSELVTPVEDLFLEVASSNDSASRLYRRCGFVEVGKRPGYYAHSSEDGIIMQHRLCSGCDHDQPV
ncbi:ribosomal protein S18-alanine N-acetyltransferase [bacterium]|nr:ribosomal protein S18-alanine N-acetyltransferase [bacterium]